VECSSEIDKLEKTKMGKISPVSIKYNVIATIQLTGVADRPDVIGAIFGQTEGLLGSELELRELQKTGKIGRIEVNVKNHGGKSDGEIIIPSSIGKSETAIIAAAIETIDRVGPCNAKIHVREIQDVRISKRDFILKRAEELLKNLVETLPDSTEFTNKVTQTVRAREVQDYGKDKLPAGPMIDSSDDVIIVEGRADVVTLLKYGIRNCIALNGSDATTTLIDLMRQKVATLFVDGDRGGDLVIKKLAGQVDVDFVTKAPDGKEVEELTLKEIQKALRAKLTWEEFTSDDSHDTKPTRVARSTTERSTRTSSTRSRPTNTRSRTTSTSSRYSDRPRSSDRPSAPRDRAPRVDNFLVKNKKELKNLADDLIGTRGAYVLDDGLNILGKVPVAELGETLGDISEPVFAVIMDGSIDSELAEAVDKKRIKHIVAKGSKNADTRARVAQFESLK
jgi:DNA primase